MTTGPRVTHGPDPLATLPDLLRRSAQGDQEAFAELYPVVAPRVFGLALRILGTRGHAEEVTQEVLLDIWRTCARFDPARGSALSWMLTIAHRRAVDRVRSAQSSTLRDDDWSARNAETTSDPTAEAAQASERADRVRAALLGLSAKQRTAVSLAYFGGHTSTEIATSLGLPASTVRSRIRDGLRALGQTLDPAAARVA